MRKAIAVLMVAMGLVFAWRECPREGNAPEHAPEATPAVAAAPAPGPPCIHENCFERPRALQCTRERGGYREVTCFRFEVEYECDERDQPIPGPEALVFIGADHEEGGPHEKCMKQLEMHPRLYVEARGDPGTFPLLCGPCVYRERFRCTHPKLKSNGGPGLAVQCGTKLGFGAGMVICSRKDGCWRPTLIAKSCEGRSHLKLVPAPAMGATS